MGGFNLYSYTINPTGWIDTLGWCGTLKTGDTFEHSIATPKGNISLLAEVEVSGKNLVLRDIAVYADTGVQTGLDRYVIAGLSEIKEIARNQGFETLAIRGQRALHSTSANPGKIVDIFIRL